jgi:hypothetical protein
MNEQPSMLVHVRSPHVVYRKILRRSSNSESSQPEVPAVRGESQSVRQRKRREGNTYILSTLLLYCPSLTPANELQA